jgi:ribosome-associated protein
MTKKRQPLPAAVDQLCATAAEAMLDKKAQHVVSLNLSQIDGAIATCFVLCNADSTTQVEAIAENVEEQVRKTLGEKPLRREGFENAIWIILDYVDVMVHIFQTEARSFYRLESLWADAEQQRYGEEPPTAVAKEAPPKAALKRKTSAKKADATKASAAEAGAAKKASAAKSSAAAATGAAKKASATKSPTRATKKAAGVAPAAAKKAAAAAKKTTTKKL